MLDASVKEKIMIMEPLHASSRSCGKIGETKQKEVAGKPIILLAPKKVENSLLKIVRSSAGAATQKP